MDMIRRMTDFTNIFEKHLDNMNEYYKKICILNSKVKPLIWDIYVIVVLQKE